jgi:hypothetical protein
MTNTVSPRKISMDAIRPAKSKLSTFESADAFWRVFMLGMILRHNSQQNSVTNGERLVTT